MNIIFTDRNLSRIFFRPDSTIEKDGSVYYAPDRIHIIEALPFRYIRMDRAGKCIAPKFAGRYFSRHGRGIALFGYADGSEKQSPDGWMKANMLDASTFIGETENLAEQDAKEDFHTTAAQAIAYASSFMSLKTGDMVCILDGTVSTPDAEGKITCGFREITVK